MLAGGEGGDWRACCRRGCRSIPIRWRRRFASGRRSVHGVDPPDWILCGNGSDDILTIVTRAFVGAGDLVRFAEPELHPLQDARRDSGRRVRRWSTSTPTGRSASEFARGERPAEARVSAEPQQPVGHDDPAGEGRGDSPTALPCPLLVDEAYVDFAETNCLSLVAENEKILVARTLSKSYALAGLRFGFVVAQPQVIAQLRKVKDSYNCDCALDRRGDGGHRRPGVARRNACRQSSRRGPD